MNSQACGGIPVKGDGDELVDGKRKIEKRSRRDAADQNDVVVGYCENAPEKEIFRTPVRTTPPAPPKSVNDYPATRFANLSPDELQAMFFEIGGKVNLAECRTTTRAELNETLLGLVEELGGGEVLLSADPALNNLGAEPSKISPAAWRWGDEEGRKNAERASLAKTGIVWASYPESRLLITESCSSQISAK